MDEPEFLVPDGIQDDQTIYSNVEVYTDTDGNFCEYTSNVDSVLDAENSDEILDSNPQTTSNLFESRQEVYIKVEQPENHEFDNGTTDDESMAVEALRQLGNSAYSNQEHNRITTTTPLDLPLLPCPTCHMEFRTTADLSSHEEICRENQFICPICSESFDRKLDMNNHLVCHAVDRPHSCRICGTLFVHKKDLQLHMQTHGANTQNQCQICGLQFNRPSSLTNHLKIHAYQPGRLIPHDIPNEEISSEPTQKIALPSIHNITMHNWNLSFEPDNFQADMSLEVAQDVTIDTTLNDQNVGFVETTIVQEPTDSKPHACNLCPKRFAREKALLSHLKLHKNVFDKNFNCDRCDQNFSNQASFDKHVSSCNIQNVKVSSTTKKIVKPAKEIVQNEVINKTEFIEKEVKPEVTSPEAVSTDYDVNVYKKIYKHCCEICGKHFSTKQKLFRHVWIHRKKQYTCEVCDKQFDRQQLLDSHRLANHQSGSPYVCSECGKNFSTRQGLWEHNRIHTVDINSFKCVECGKTFTSRQGFLIHQRKHKGERPYGCRYCWKAFRDGGTLRKHERIHTGERPHACPLCSKAFNQKVVLREHIRMRHTTPMEPDAEGKFGCTICTIKTSDKDELCVHFVKHSDQMAQLAKDASKNNIPKTPETTRKRKRTVTPKVEVLPIEQLSKEDVEDEPVLSDFEHKIEILEEQVHENNIEFADVEGECDNLDDSISTGVINSIDGGLMKDIIEDTTEDPLINRVDNENDQTDMFSSVQCHLCGIVLNTKTEFNEHSKAHV